MATFNLCNQFDQIADGKVIYHGTEHTEYADLEQPEEEKPKKKFNGGRLFGKFLGGLVAVVAVSAVVGLAVAYAVSVVLTGGASLAALPAVAAGAGAAVAAFTAYRSGRMLEAQYNQDMANQEESSWGDYIGGALVNTAQIGAEEAVTAILFAPAGVVGERVVGAFAAKYGSKLFAKRAIGKTIGKWFKLKPKPKPPMNKPMKRPSWRQSEKDIANEYPGYREQVVFQGGKEVPKKVAGSTVPDLYRAKTFFRRAHAIEVKNYLLSEPANRKNLVNVLKKQINHRATELPKGTRQTIILDVRGQTISKEVLKALKAEIKENVPKGVEVLFKMK